jgi:hypothetical protein
MLVTTVLVTVMVCEILLNICYNISKIAVIIIQFNSIFIYLHANITAQRPSIKLTRVKKRNKIQEQGNLYEWNNDNDSININHSYDTYD